MKKLLLILLFIPLVSFGQDTGGLLTYNNNPTGSQINGYDLLNSFVLKNGNILYFAIVNLDYKTIDSECQCDEYSFGTVFWIFEKDNEDKIVKQRCYKKDDFLNLVKFKNDYRMNKSNLWESQNCSPNITKVFYRGDDLYFVFASNEARLFRDAFLNGQYSSGKILSKFNLETFDFFDSKGIGGSNAGSGYNKIFFIDDKYPVSLTLSSHTGGSYSHAITNGYQNFVFEGIDESDYRYSYNITNRHLISEIFNGNSKNIILDYKQDDKDSLTFLVASNSLDGLYVDGEEYKTSLYIIKTNFTTYRHNNTGVTSIQVDVEYNVTKSKLNIPRNINLSYDDYSVFVDSNNSFVINVKKAENGSPDMDIYNKLHFLYDDSSYKSIKLDNDFSIKFDDVDGYYPLGSYVTSIDNNGVITNNIEALSTSSQGDGIGHHLIDIEFNKDNFVSLEHSRLTYLTYDSVGNNTSSSVSSPLRIIKVFDYEGTLLSRDVFFTDSKARSVNQKITPLNLKPSNLTKFHELVEFGSDSADFYMNFVGLSYLYDNTFLIDNFDNNTWCGDGLEIANQFVYKLKYVPNFVPEAISQDVTATEQVEIDITLSGTDLDGDSLTYSIIDNPVNGTVTLENEIATYVSNSDTALTDSFTFAVNDGAVYSEKAFVNIEITPVNDQPEALTQSITMVEDTVLDIILSAEDVDGDELTYSIVDNPTNSKLDLSDNKVTFTPNTGYFGEDSFTFLVNDGTIDSEKATISITVTSNDLDEDGVLNNDDTCPDSPEGSTVDLNGCPIFTLPLDNNKVSVISASCIGNTDGSIGISIEDESYNYTVTVTGQDDPISLGGETKTASVTGLGTGTYTVCFKVDGQDAYEQCFEVNIGEPKALSAFIDVDNDNRTTSIQLSGSSSYNVEVNGQRFDVKGDRFTTNLPSGLSIIKISTDLDCQGVIEREIFISEDIHYYPNPTQTDVNVHVSGEDTMVQVSVFSEKGDLIYTREQQIQDFSRKTNIDLSRQITGTYIVVLDGPTVRKTFKIVKR